MVSSEEFGANVKNARDLRGWSRADLLRELASLGVDMHATTLKRIEDGLQVAKITEAEAMAVALDTSISELIYGSSSAGAAVSRAIMSATDAARDTAEAWMKWTRESAEAWALFEDLDGREGYSWSSEEQREALEWVSHPSAVFSIVDHLGWRPTDDDLNGRGRTPGDKGWAVMVSYFMRLRDEREAGR